MLPSRRCRVLTDALVIPERVSPLLKHLSTGDYYTQGGCPSRFSPFSGRCLWTGWVQSEAVQAHGHEFLLLYSP